MRYEAKMVVPRMMWKVVDKKTGQIVETATCKRMAEMYRDRLEKKERTNESPETDRLAAGNKNADDDG